MTIYDSHRVASLCLNDFHCNFLIKSNKNRNNKNIPYPLSEQVSYEKILEKQRLVVFSVFKEVEPSNYSQVASINEWYEAMKEELVALKHNTRYVVSLPHGKHSVGCKWTYKLKFKQDNTIL